MFVQILLLFCIGSAHSTEIPGEMAKGGFQSFFPMGAASVSNYSIVHRYLSNIQKRDTHGRRSLRLEALGENLELLQNPIDGVLASATTPIWTLRKGYDLTRHSSAIWKTVDQLHIDPGTDKHLKKLRSFFGRSVDSLSYQNHTANFVHKVPKTHSIQSKSLQIREASMEISRRSLPDVVYPEIMVIVDHSIYAELDFDLDETVKYLLAFWNSVDMRFRALENPRYRLNIAGIIIAEEPKALSFLNYFTYRDGEKNIDQKKSLQNFGKFALKLEKLIPQYKSDVLITMTSDTLCSQQGKKKCTAISAGISYRAGACSGPISNKGGSSVIPRKVGIVQDSTGFNSINVAARELGHLLGSKYDDVGNKRCSKNAGNIMVAGRKTEKLNGWSECTLEDFESFLRMERAKCLFNKPKLHGSKELKRILAGQLLEADGQCKRIFGEGAKLHDKSHLHKLSCTQLNCFHEGNIRQTTIADGTTCAQGKFCLDRKCVEDIRNIH